MQNAEMAIMIEVARVTGVKLWAFTNTGRAEILSYDLTGQAKLRHEAQQYTFVNALAYMVGTPSNAHWRITPESREVLAKLSTAWHIRMQVQHLYPHLATIREAYPDVRFYTVKDFRLTDIRRHALIAQYGHAIQDVASGPALFKSFAIDLAGLITYAEVEEWRYEQADLESLYAAAI